MDDVMAYDNSNGDVTDPDVLKSDCKSFGLEQDSKPPENMNDEGGDLELCQEELQVNSDENHKSVSDQDSDCMDNSVTDENEEGTKVDEVLLEESAREDENADTGCQEKYHGQDSEKDDDSVTDMAEEHGVHEAEDNSATDACEEDSSENVQSLHVSLEESVDDDEVTSPVITQDSVTLPEELTSEDVSPADDNGTGNDALTNVIADDSPVEVESNFAVEKANDEVTITETASEVDTEPPVEILEQPTEPIEQTPDVIPADNIGEGMQPCVQEVETIQVSSKNVEKIKELEEKVHELEDSCKEKDATITSLKGEIEKLNSELKSRSVPAAKKPSGGATDNKAKTVGAKRTTAATTRPSSGAKAVANGSDARKGAVSPTKRPPSSSANRGAKPATKPVATVKPTSAVKTTGGGKKTGKTPNRVEMAKGHDGEEHAVKLTLRGRGIVCYPPTGFKMEDINSEKPEESLSISWVYGYRGRDSQDNIFTLPSNELLYFQAAVGVIYNPETRTQRFYQGHNDDIKCIALNPANPSIVATGQAAGHDEKEGDPHVRVWNCETLETLAVLGLGVLQRAVGSVSFSPDGSRVIAVDEGNDHTIYVYDWKKKSQIASQKGHQDPVLGAEFLPTCDSKFVTYGKGHIIFWELDGHKLVKKSGLFEKHAKPRFVTSLAFNSKGEPISGDSNGNLYLWNPNERKITKAKTSLHEGSVYSIAVKGDDVYTGGQDCKVKKCNGDDLSELDSWQLDEDAHGRVRAIAFVGEKLAVGTYNNGMLFGSFGEEPQQIIHGHGAGDLWGGAVHPVDNTFATVGQDKVVYIWDAANHVPKHIFKVEKPAQSCAFSPDGSVLAVASTTGEWWVLDSTSGDVLSSYKSGPEQIDAISYSPDGTLIAVGSHDNATYIYSSDDLRAEYKLVGKCSGHSSFITHLDFSQDGKILQTTSGDYEHLFWETETGEQITNSKDLRDTTMATYTCILGFPVCGIWPVGYDGTDINSLCRSHNSNLVATADDFGLVNLFRYPCCDPTAAWSSFRGHSAHVTKIRFLNGDKELFSLGGRDQSIIQWGVC